MRSPVNPILPLSSGALTLAEFWSDLRFAPGNPAPELAESTVSNTTAGGEPITASFGARLWTFAVHLAAMPVADLNILAGRLHHLADGGQTFIAVPPFSAFPASDPQGLYMGGAAPVIDSLPVGGRTLTLSGLPGHYTLTAGDFIAFQRGSPARFELHRLVTGGRASSAGLSPEVQLTPPLRPGVLVGAAVTLINPAMRAKIVPGSLRLPGLSRAAVGGVTFEVMQTLQKSG